ncbi:MAG: hypothetical protein V4657_08250 [Pseudomonadota bacterium]
MNRKVILSFAALGVLVHSMPATAYHDPQDRTQDYVEPKDGPLLQPDTDLYGWQVDGERVLVTPERSTHRHDHSHQRSFTTAASAPMVTVILMAPAIITTTTVTEEIYYETVRRPVHKKPVRKWKPKPRCVCR